MSKIQFSEEYECTVCKVKGTLLFKKPSAFEPSVTRFNCKNCLSRFMVIVKKGKGDKGQYTTQEKVQSLSSIAKDIINQRAEERTQRAKERAQSAMKDVRPNQE